MQNLNGKTIGRYKIIEKLGQGGMAVVYKAFDTHQKRHVAIKIIRKESFGELALERIRKRFEREARALKKLDHPNIINILDFGRFRDSPYIVMDIQTRTTLKDIKKPLNYKKAAQFLIPIASALAHAHKNGILHRDLKPSNILFNKNAEPLLTDFGIAKILEDEEVHTITSTGMGLGTPEYMSPEQGAGETVDWRTDIYALGIIFFELITAKKPFTGDTPMSVIIKQMTSPLLWSEELSDLPDTAIKILRKTLAKSPKDRYENISELLIDLKRVEEYTLIKEKESENKNNHCSSLKYIVSPAQSQITFDINEQTTRDEFLTGTKFGSTVQRTDSKRKKLNPIILGFGIFTILLALTSAVLLIKTAISSLQIGPSLTIFEDSSDLAQSQSILDNNIPKSSTTINSTETYEQTLATPIILEPDVIQLTNASNLSEIYIWGNYRGEMISWMSDNSGFFLASQYQYKYYYFTLFQEIPEDFRKDTTYIYMAALGTEAKYFATTTQQNQFSIWQHEAESPLFSKNFEQISTISLPEFSGDNQWIVGYFDNQVQLFSIKDGNLELGIDFPLGEGQMSENPMMIFEFSDDSTFLAIGNQRSGEIQVWDIKNQSAIQSFKWHVGVTTIAFSPDGKNLVSGSPTYSDQDNIRFWNIESGDLIFSIKKNNEHITSIDFSIDGKVFASGARSGAIRFWNSLDGTLIQTYKIDDDSVDILAFSPNGKYLLTAGQKTVLWGIENN